MSVSLSTAAEPVEPAPDADDAGELREAATRHRKPSTTRAVWQLSNTLVPYVALWIAMPFALDVSVWLFLPLAVMCAGFLVRTFILFHDCVHGTFFASRAANDWCGRILGLLVFTCFDLWRAEHIRHHATSGDLDRRGTGDIWTLTVDEYRAARPLTRFAYRLSRHPVVLLVIAPLLMMVVWQRWPSRERRAERVATWWQNALLVLLVAVLAWVCGPLQYLVMQGTVIALAGAAGVWLFYVQHQFAGVYWGRGKTWSVTAAALSGSSYYRLPALLQWFSANIGFHHVHHLDARIPNYNLARCHREIQRFRRTPALGLWESRRSLRLALWDEQAGELVGFARLRRKG